MLAIAGKTVEPEHGVTQAKKSKVLLSKSKFSFFKIRFFLNSIFFIPRAAPGTSVICILQEEDKCLLCKDHLEMKPRPRGQLFLDASEQSEDEEPGTGLQLLFRDKIFLKISSSIYISTIVFCVQSYTQRKRLKRRQYRIYAVCFFMFMIPCNLKLCFFL